MFGKTQGPPSNFPQEQALQWFVYLQSGEATCGDQRRFEAWVRENPSNWKEYDYFSRIWTNLDKTRSLVASEINQAEAVWNTDASNRFSVCRQKFFLCGRVPVVVGALMAIAVVTPWLESKLDVTESRYQTVKGEQQSITLPDGSQVTMNTDTKISVRLSDSERVVTLGNGEALFTVTHDEKRPFEVRAGNGTVRDLGTQFTVYKSPEKVNVSVLEGVVDVGLREPTGSSEMSQSQIVKQGQKIWYTFDGRMSSVETFDQETENSWIEGRLIFQGRPLEQVLKELGRYQSGEIRLLDPSLGTTPVTGIFNIHDLGSFMNALQDTLPVRVTQINPGLVIVERALNPDQSSPTLTGQPTS